MTPIKDAATSPSDDLIAFAITEAFGERCPTADADCYTCQAWGQYDKLKALTTPAPGRDELRTEQLRIQALGAAISRRDWYAAERSYEAIRDEFDQRAILSALPAAPVKDGGEHV